MKNVIPAIGNKIVAKRLLNLARKYTKDYNVSFSEAVELAMRKSVIWKGYEYLI